MVLEELRGLVGSKEGFGSDSAFSREEQGCLVAAFLRDIIVGFGGRFWMWTSWWKGKERGREVEMVLV
jgi:hypothetical protein